MVSPKYPPKVKLELFTILKYQNWDELCVPIFWESLDFYSSVELISYACATSLSLIRNIFINVRIFQNPPYVRVLFVVGLYGLGLIVRHKLFSFRVSWEPHNGVPRGFLSLSTLGPSTRFVHKGSVYYWLIWAVRPSIWICSYPFIFDSSCLCREIHSSESVTSDFFPLQIVISISPQGPQQQ